MTLFVSDIATKSHCQRSVTATQHTARFHNWIRVTLGALRTAQYSGQHSQRQNTHTKTPRCCAWRTHKIWLIPALQPLQRMSLKRARWSETKHNANIFTGPFTSLSIRRPLTRLTFKDKVSASSVCLVTQTALMRRNSVTILYSTGTLGSRVRQSLGKWKQGYVGGFVCR